MAGIDHGLESYFSADSKKLIFYGKNQADDKTFSTYMINVDGSGLTRINSDGGDACSFFFPSDNKVIYTSTKDHSDKPAGNWSSSRHKQGKRKLSLFMMDVSSLGIEPTQQASVPAAQRSIFGW